MKKFLLFTLAFLFFSHAFQSKAQCAFTYTNSGNTYTFTHLWAIVGIQSLDSVNIDFGDGTSVHLVAPVSGTSVHTFPGAGVYNVCLTRYLSSLANPGVPIPCTSCQTITIAGAPACFVTSNYLQNVSGAVVSFTNTTSCATCVSSTSSWNFGDGSPLSSTISPTHTYTTSGTYNVCLVTTGVNANSQTCLDTFCSNITVTVPPPPSCMSLANYNDAGTGLTHSFTNTSTCTACVTTTYSWNFGDGSPLNNSMSPSHTYAAAGTYNVCLTATGVDANSNSCTDDTCRQITITNTGGCVANSNFNFNTTGSSVAFSNMSTCTSCVSSTYNWDFGDGASSNLPNPVHNYATIGNYNVCLTLNGTTSTLQTCNDSMCRGIFINSLGVNDVNKYQLSIFPNPGKTIVWITLPKANSVESIEIIDLAGRILKVETLNSNASGIIPVDVQNLSKGAYMLHLRTSEGLFSAKMMVE